LDEEDSNARYMLKRDMQVSDQIFIKMMCLCQVLFVIKVKNIYLVVLKSCLMFIVLESKDMQ